MTSNSDHGQLAFFTRNNNSLSQLAISSRYLNSLSQLSCSLRGNNSFSISGELLKTKAAQMSDVQQPQKACQPNPTQTKQSMYRLQRSMLKFLCTYLAHQKRMGSLDSSRFSNLDWKNPRQQELEAISFIKNEMKDVLQQQSSHGTETSQMELLMDVFKQLWAYFLLNQRNEAQVAMPASQHYDQEWRDSSSSITSISEDCDALANNLQQQTESLHQNEICKEDSSNFQNLRRILDYLKKRTIRRSQSRNAQTTSYDEDKALEELDRILR